MEFLSYLSGTALWASIWTAPLPEIQAYLDPGSGSFLIQLLIGGIVGLAFILKTFWGRIKRFFATLLGRAEPGPVQPEEHEPSGPTG